MIFKEIVHNYKEATHEEVPQEDLWEDGELSTTEVQHKILHHTFQQGDWIMIRELDKEDI